MPPFSLSQTDADCVKVERNKHSNSIIRKRMYVLHLLHYGYSRKECAHIVGCHINSVTNYIKMYHSGGLEAIRTLNYSYPRHELEKKYEQVQEVIEKSNCCTIADVREVLRKDFGYNRSKEAVRKLLHKLGFKRRKTGTFPGKVDNFEAWQAKQEAFIKKLNRLISKAKKGKLDLVFGDAAHFVYGKFNSYYWGKSVRYSPSGHGRHRVNVYGIYDVTANQVFSMYNDEYIDAEFVVELLNWLRKDIYQNKKRPLHVVLDNARYQHCQYVKQWAKELKIRLEFLPGYSPNLNLIERLWRYMKKILAKEYHNSKEAFEKAVVKLLKSLNRKAHQDKLWTLLNPLFQRFEKSQILTW